MHPLTLVVSGLLFFTLNLQGDAREAFKHSYTVSSQHVGMQVGSSRCAAQDATQEGIFRKELPQLGSHKWVTLPTTLKTCELYWPDLGYVCHDGTSYETARHTIALVSPIHRSTFDLWDVAKPTRTQALSAVQGVASATNVRNLRVEELEPGWIVLAEVTDSKFSGAYFVALTSLLSPDPTDRFPVKIYAAIAIADSQDDGERNKLRIATVNALKSLSPLQQSQCAEN